MLVVLPNASVAAWDGLRDVNTVPVCETIARPTAEPTATVIIATIIIIMPKAAPSAMLNHAPALAVGAIEMLTLFFTGSNVISYDVVRANQKFKYSVK